MQLCTSEMSQNFIPFNICKNDWSKYTHDAKIYSILQADMYHVTQFKMVQVHKSLHAHINPC